MFSVIMTRNLESEAAAAVTAFMCFSVDVNSLAASVNSGILVFQELILRVG